MLFMFTCQPAENALFKVSFASIILISFDCKTARTKREFTLNIDGAKCTIFEKLKVFSFRSRPQSFLNYNALRHAPLLMLLM